jgi:hypothetical protein
LPLDLEYLRRHYADLSDEGLQAIDRHGLVPAAQALYDEELARRAPWGKPVSPPPPVEEEEPAEELDDAEGVEPEWLEQAACAVAFTTSAPAVNARDVLENAGIPCHLTREKVLPEDAPSQPDAEYRVMVPGPQNLEAVSILDQEIFNEQLEAGWRAQMEILSDEELLALNPETICAGILDRAERLRRAYGEEKERRGLIRGSRTGSPQ